MLKGFICPDGSKVDLDSCFQSCRMPRGERCMTLPTLTAMAEEREWSGVPSTTQLLNGTQMEFLKLTQPYWVNPDSRAFMVSGTRHHQQLEVVAKELGLVAEVALSVDRDIFDLLEWEGKELVLTDRKMWGSFKVAKALGLVQVGKEPDPSGAVYKSSGKHGKAGDPKMIPVWSQDPELVDTWEAELQLNRYRVMLGKLGVHVHKLQLEVLVRDGGLYIAKDRGVDRNIYKIPIAILPDQEVEGYFDFKTKCLLEALEQGHWDYPCTIQESWEGRRCDGYCDVWEHCSKGRLVQGLGGE